MPPGRGQRRRRVRGLRTRTFLEGNSGRGRRLTRIFSMRPLHAVSVSARFVTQPPRPTFRGSEHEVQRRTRAARSGAYRRACGPRRNGLAPHDPAEHRQETSPLGAKSIEHVLGTLRRLLGFAELQDLVTENAVERWKRGLRLGRRRSAPTYRVKRENVLDSEELDRLLALAAGDTPDHFGLILFLADTGARLGEALALRWVDVDLERGMARVCRSYSDGKYITETKTGRERPVELSRRLRAELQARRPDPFGNDTPVFPISWIRTTSVLECSTGLCGPLSGHSAASRRMACGTRSQPFTSPAGRRSSGCRYRAAGRVPSSSSIGTGTSCRVNITASRTPSRRLWTAPKRRLAPTVRFSGKPAGRELKHRRG